MVMFVFLLVFMFTLYCFFSLVKLQVQVFWGILTTDRVLLFREQSAFLKKLDGHDDIGFYCISNTGQRFFLKQLVIVSEIATDLDRLTHLDMLFFESCVMDIAAVSTFFVDYFPSLDDHHHQIQEPSLEEHCLPSPEFKAVLGFFPVKRMSQTLAGQQS